MGSSAEYTPGKDSTDLYRSSEALFCTGESSLEVEAGGHFGGHSERCCCIVFLTPPQPLEGRPPQDHLREQQGTCFQSFLAVRCPRELLARSANLHDSSTILASRLQPPPLSSQLAMAAIHSLPPELIALIFSLVSESPECVSHLYPTLCAAALVCRAWRRLAQSRLWHRVQIGVPWRLTAFLNSTAATGCRRSAWCC